MNKTGEDDWTATGLTDNLETQRSMPHNKQPCLWVLWERWLLCGGFEQPCNANDL